MGSYKIDEDILELLKNNREVWSDRHDYTLKKILERYFEKIDFLYPKQYINNEGGNSATIFYIFVDKKLFTVVGNQGSFALDYIGENLKGIQFRESRHHEKFELELKFEETTINLSSEDCNGSWAEDFKGLAQNIFKYLTAA
ncbi:hypothetical protein [Virgibacillus oceani]|uniref:Uncharacterized protein n=1 Tax=Virgibacillus oceani TaxID=1479511 RepID=A0A917LXQ7_9BACI|nr:hypothetical protein [Virgibacillus oceani]GGG64670.1 hypothetical protein GCM10011398_05350 [Virgibacillus oceani]